MNHIFDSNLKDGTWNCQCGYVTNNPDAIMYHADHTPYDWESSGDFPAVINRKLNLCIDCSINNYDIDKNSLENFYSDNINISEVQKKIQAEGMCAGVYDDPQLGEVICLRDPHNGPHKVSKSAVEIAQELENSGN